MSDLVIGEGVALDLRLAKLPSRALAKLIDGFVQGAAGLLLFMLVAVVGASGLDTAVLTALVIVVSVLVLVGYPILFETVASGRTLGKMAMGLRVVRMDGAPLRFRHALVRGVTGIFDFPVTVGALAVATSFCSRDGRRTGDFLAGTVVVRDRTPDAGVSPRGLAALSMPYPLLQWAQALDLTRVPDDLALAARQYLTRMYDMRPEVAARMGYDLATEMAQYVAQPPQGTPSWAYLAAVTAERRARQVRKAEAERHAAWEQHNARLRTAWEAQHARQDQQNVPAQRYTTLQDTATGQQQPTTVGSAEPAQAPTAPATSAGPTAATEGEQFAPPQ